MDDNAGGVSILYMQSLRISKILINRQKQNESMMLIPIPWIIVECNQSYEKITIWSREDNDVERVA